MKMELPYFNIENSFGGNQNWFRDPIMRLGGCAAATACDACIYMARHEGKHHLYPYDVDKLSKEDYIGFSKIMKPYLTPRLQGIDTLMLYIDGVNNYLEEVGEQKLSLTGFPGDMSVSEATKEIRGQIDNKKVIPFLLLKHKNTNFKDFVWHWFLIVGYEAFESELYIKVATYGEFHWLSFNELWNTGYSQKGGMILFR